MHVRNLVNKTPTAWCHKLNICKYKFCAFPDKTGLGPHSFTIFTTKGFKFTRIVKQTFTYSIIAANFKVVEYKPFNDKIRDANYAGFCSNSHKFIIYVTKPTA